MLWMNRISIKYIKFLKTTILVLFSFLKTLLSVIYCPIISLFVTYSQMKLRLFSLERPFKRQISKQLIFKISMKNMLQTQKIKEQTYYTTLPLSCIGSWNNTYLFSFGCKVHSLCLCKWFYDVYFAVHKSTE